MEEEERTGGRQEGKEIGVEVTKDERTTGDWTRKESEASTQD